MKGLNKKAFDLKFKSPHFLGDYKQYYFEFTGSRAKMNGEYLKKLELLRLISTFDNDLAMSLLSERFIPYEDVAMHLMRGLFQFCNVSINSDAPRLRIAMQPISSQEVIKPQPKELSKADKDRRGRARYVLRRAEIIKGSGFSDTIDTLHVSKLFSITDDELLKEHGCGPKTVEWINKFKNELKVLLSNN